MDAEKPQSIRRQVAAKTIKSLASASHGEELQHRSSFSDQSFPRIWVGSVRAGLSDAGSSTSIRSDNHDKQNSLSSWRHTTTAIPPPGIASAGKRLPAGRIHEYSAPSKRSCWFDNPRGAVMSNRRARPEMCNGVHIRCNCLHNFQELCYRPHAIPRECGVLCPVLPLMARDA